MEGLISKEVVELKWKEWVEEESRVSLAKWAQGLVLKLLKVTHGQLLYRNIHVHNRISGDLAPRGKEEIRWELVVQLELGGEGLEVEEHYLLDINLDDMET
jgi:hypothetical protein